MKLTLILLTAFLLNATAKGVSQEISFSGKNVPLEKIFQHIKKNTGFYVLYRTEFLQGTIPVSIEASNMPLIQFLDKVLEKQSLGYEITNTTISIRKVISPENTELKSTTPSFYFIPITGKITDGLGNPLAGVNVVIKGSKTGTVTDATGAFSLNASQGDVLVFSSIGFQTQEIKIQSEVLLKVSLEKDVREMEEVVLNKGYYSETKRLSTGNISKVSAKEIEMQPVLNPLAALIGRMPGVHITQSTGIPGSGFTVEVRGRNTISTLGNPLYIVDGVPFSSEGMGSTNIGFVLGISQAVAGVSTFGMSPLSAINPADIESIEVLKDADATAIYGSRGANGVVLITTKKPKAEHTTLNVRYSKGMGKAPMNYKLLNTASYLEMRREAYANGGITSYPANAYDVNGTWDPNRYTDWQKTLVGGTASQDNLQATISGGNAQTKFMVGGSLLKETGVFPGDYGNNKLSGKSVLTHKSEDGRFDLSMTINYTVDKNDFPGTDLNYYAVQLSPNAPALYQEDGKLNWENGTWTNPLSYTEENYRSKLDNLMANAILGYKLWKGLSLKTSVAFNNLKMNDSRTQPNTRYNPIYGLGPENSSISFSTTSRQSWNLEPQLLYNSKFGNFLSVEALIGTTFQQSTNDYIEQRASGFTSNSLIYDVKAATNQSITTNTANQYRYSALFGRLNLNWNARYILNLTARRDGSSRFGPGRQFANFGAIGAAWLFSEENGVQEKLPFLSFGKLRGSVGITGSDNVGDYKFLDTYATSTLTYQNVKSLQPSGLFNPDFAWESNQKRELAMDLGFFSDRIQLSASYYHNLSSNQLVGIPLSGVTGFKSIQANLDATVLNSGWEFELSTTNIQKKGFSWKSSINWTIPHNELVSFPGLKGSTYATRYIIGQPLNIIKVFDFLGVDPQTGQYKFRDLNGDGLFNTDDRQSIGRINQQFYGGINNSIVIGKFHVDLFFQFVKQMGRNYFYGTSMPGYMINQPIEVMSRWRQPGDISSIQRFALGNNDLINAYNNIYYSTGAYSDASYIRLKNLMISYELSGKKMGSKKGHVFVQGQNLLTFTGYRGLDPETNSSANSSVPPLRMITLGVGFNL